MQQKLKVLAAILMVTGVFIGAALAAGVPADPGSGTAHRVPATTSLPAPPGMDTAYANNETIYASAGVQYVQEINTVPFQVHGPGAYLFTMPGKGAVYLETPFAVPVKKNGKDTRARFLWFTMKMPADVYVSSVLVNSGPLVLYSNYTDRRGTGTMKTYVIDMGSWKTIPYGIDLHLEVVNPNASGRNVYTYGASLLEAW